MPLLRACDVTVSQDVEPVYELVHGLSTGSAPSAVSAAHLSEWRAVILHRAEKFCALKANNQAVHAIMFGGKEALGGHLQAFLTQTGPRKESSAQALKAYKWLLPENSRVVLDEFVDSLVVTARGRLSLD